MKVRFWGVRGSLPSPDVTGDLEARLVQVLARLADEKSPPDLQDAEATLKWIRTLPAPLRVVSGGNTPCVEMRTAAGDIFIMDAGSGIRALGHALINENFGTGQGHAHIFFSHYHWDHLQGWPFFPPIYVPGNRFDLYARHDKLKEHLKKQQTAPFFPPAAWDDAKASFAYHQLTPEPFELCEGRVKISSIALDHPSRAYAYKFETDDQIFIYASDGAYHDLDEDAIRPYVEFFKGADLLIFDAQFTLSESYEKRTWGHSSAVIGVEIACQAAVKRLALFHHDPAATEEQLEHWLHVAQQYSAAMPSSSSTHCQVIMAREGETIELYELRMVKIFSILSSQFSIFMIARLSGKLIARGEGSLIIEVGGLGYEVQVPLVVEKALDTFPLGEPLHLETVYYLQMDQNRATPVLIGFQNSIQKEFFEKLLTVPKMGPKATLGAFARPVSTIASAIETANYTVLQGLPGIGKQRARDLVATLQGKIAMFALMQDSDLDKRAAVATSDVAAEALQLLVMLGHKRPDAERMVQSAIAAEPAAPDAETLVRVIYRKQQEAK